MMDSEKKKTGPARKLNNGRPRKIFIGDDDWSRAKDLGEGQASAGIRRALTVVSRLKDEGPVRLSEAFRVSHLSDDEFLSEFWPSNSAYLASALVRLRAALDRLDAYEPINDAIPYELSEAKKAPR